MCVSALLIKEIKRIIKESEIMKYVVFLPTPHFLTHMKSGAMEHMLIFFFFWFIGKMTRNGPGRIKMVVKNLRFG